MNTPHTHRTSRSRRSRKLAAAFGSLGLASTLAFSGLVGEGVTETEAAWTDTEKATAEVKAAWPEAFVSVVAGSARSATEMDNPSEMTYQSQFRWTSQLALPPIEPAGESTSGWATHNRIWDQRFQGVGVAVDDWQPPPGAPNYLGSLDDSGLDLHDGRAVREFTNPGTRTYPRNYRCLVINETFENATNRSDCDLGNNFAAAKNTTDAAGFSIGTGLTQFTYLNAAHLATGVQCSLNSATATEPTGRIDFGQESSLGGQGNQNLDYGGLLNQTNPRTVWSNGGYGALSNSGFPPNNNSISGMWTVQNILGISTHAKVMPVITRYASLPGAQPYAISEIAAYIEVYRREIAGAQIELHGKMYFVLSRSECGVKRRGQNENLPAPRPVFPDVMPGGNGLAPLPGGTWEPTAEISQPSVLQGLLGGDDAFNELPPMTTVTSPTEHTTASETTTSAPPNPDDADESTSSTSTARTSTTQTSTSKSVTGTSTSTSTTTKVPATTATTSSTTAPTTVSTPPAGPTATSTSAAPAIVVPDEPGKLSPAARLEEAGIAEVDGEELVVVVKGDTIPADARQGVAALEIWLGGGNPGSTWKTFASDDPDEDGWRWAAINQKTGTVVYIR